MKRKYNIFSYFSEYSIHGVSFSIIEHEMKWPFEDEKYTFVQEIELDIPTKEDLNKAAVAKLDSDIADLYNKISAIKEKKQQLLALEHKELS